MHMTMNAARPFLVSLLLWASAMPEAHAIFRAYLASDGSDANPCTLVAPCRLLPAALAAVDNGGQIWMLDSANYNTGTVNIAKSVSILAVPGAVGSVLAIAGPAITVSTFGVKVSLRNLVIGNLPGGGGTDGVAVNANETTVALEECLIENVPGRGVHATNISKVQLVSSTVRSVGDTGVFVEGGANAVVSRSRLLSNPYGVGATANVPGITRVVVTDSLISGGGTTGVYAYAYDMAPTAYARAVVTGSTIEGLVTAVYADGAGSGGLARLNMSGNTISNNSYSYYQVGGYSVIVSYGHNQISENTTFLGTLTTLPMQ